MEANTPIKFEILAGHQIIRTEILTGPVIKVGKLSSHQLKLMDDPSISRLHAEIEVRGPNEVILKDMGSDQGTFVNQKPVMRAKLMSGDRIKFGNVECVVTVAGQAARPRQGQPAAGQGSPQAQRAQTPRVPHLGAERDYGFGNQLQVLALYDTSVIAYEQYHETEPGVFTLGFDVDADCVMTPNVLPTADQFPLAEMTESRKMLVHIPDVAQGEVMLNGKIFDLDGLKQAGHMSRGRVPQSSTLALPLRARCRLTIGEFSFLISAMPDPGRAPKIQLVDRIDLPFMGSVAFVALLFGFLSFAISMIPPAPADLSLSILENQQRFLEVMLEAEEEIKEKKPGGDEGEKAAKSEGKMGSEQSTDQDKRFQNKGLESKIAQMSKSEKSDLAASTVAEMTGSLAGLMGSAPIAMGSIDAFQGNITGASVGAAAGLGGLGGVGSGIGGGGQGLFGVGLSTAGSGGGSGGNGYGAGEGKTGSRRARKPRVIPMNAKVDGGNLPKEVVRRVIMSRAGAYQNCYERQLVAKRNLSGKIEVLIRISNNGRVLLSKVASTTMNNRKVERCITKVIKLLRFPRPKNGKPVKVRYPFRFKPGG